MNRYISAFHRMLSAFENIAPKHHTNKIRLLLDALICWILYGVTPNEYVGFAFFEKNSIERRRFYTARHSRKYEKKFNDPQYASVFWNKQDFNERFGKYISREYLYIPKATEDDFV